MKTLSKAECEKIANEVFEGYPRVNKVIVTSDGQAFISDTSDMAAKNHANNNRYKKELALYTFLRPDKDVSTALAKGAGSDKPTPADELLLQIEKAQTTEEVEAILNAEQGIKKPRKSVVDAATKKLETLKTA